MVSQISYPCPPSNESNSSTRTLFNFPSFLPKDECYDPVDSFEISLFDELDNFYACGHDADLSYAYGDERAIVPYVKHELLLLHRHMIVLLYFWILPTTLYQRSSLLLRTTLMGYLLPLHMMILMNIICMCLPLLLAIIMREELYLHLSMFPIR